MGVEIGRITTKGEITELKLPHPYSSPWSVAAGPDGVVWLSAERQDVILRAPPDGHAFKLTTEK